MASRVQSSGLQSGEDVTSDSFTLAGVAAGSLLVLCVASWRDITNFPAPTVSDNNGNTWVRVNGGYQAGSGNQTRVDIYYAQNANAGNTTVTVTANGPGAYLQWVVEEWSGMETADVVDTSGFAQSTTGDAAVTQSATTSQAESVTFAAMTAYVTGDLGAASPSGYTRMAYQSDPELLALEASYKINSSAAQESASWSHANTGQTGWGAVIATFKAAAGGGETGGQVTEAGSASAAFSAVVNAPASFSAAASAQATYATVAQVAAGLVAAASAQDSHGETAAAVAELTAAGTGDALLDAVAQAAAAIMEAASAGESWVSDAQAVADLVAAGSAAESITAAADNAESAAINEATTAAASFLAAAQTAAALTATASASDAIAALAAAIGAMSASGDAQATLAATVTDANERSFTASGTAQALWATVAQVAATLSAALSANAVMAATAAVSASISESGSAQATFAARLGGYLVVGSITVLAALSGTPRVTPALSGTPRVTPALSGSVTVKPS